LLLSEPNGVVGLIDADVEMEFAVFKDGDRIGVSHGFKYLLMGNRSPKKRMKDLLERKKKVL
jgi:hypothetical protein